MRGAGKAAELIDLNRHQGKHPRVGAADVIPFMPLARIQHGRRGCRGPSRGRRNLAPLRRSRCIFTKARRGSQSESDSKKSGARASTGFRPISARFPLTRPRERRWCGAREFLIAYNVDLETTDLAVARAIARRIRESSGGFRRREGHGTVFAVAKLRTGVDEPDQFRQYAARGTVSRRSNEEAARLGTRVARCELIGFIPRARL